MLSASLARRYASRSPYNVWPVYGDTEITTCRRFRRRRRRRRRTFVVGARGKDLVDVVDRPRVIEYSVAILVDIGFSCVLPSSSSFFFYRCTYVYSHGRFSSGMACG